LPRSERVILRASPFAQTFDAYLQKRISHNITNYNNQPLFYERQRGIKRRKWNRTKGELKGKSQHECRITRSGKS
jgi:ABC-type transporter MlaC component